MEIVQIVPSFPPAINGVGDYGYLLARQLRAAHDIHTRFIVCDPSWEGGSEFHGFTVERVDTRRPDELERALGAPGVPATVLLHYVGYGYQKRGCPFWLVRGLESWKSRGANLRLISMFHELYASGPPWRSSFWTSPLQRVLTKSLALLADHSVSNLKNSMQALVRMTAQPENKFSVLPVFSNVGESNSPSNLFHREPRMVVFGNPAWRRQAYFEHRAALEQACRELGITEMVDIGPPCGDIPKLAVACIQLGCLPPEQVSRELSDSRAGFFTYPARCLGKSGIFAAYAAHGVVPLTYAENAEDNTDGLRANEHFLPVSSKYRCDPGQIETISQKAHDWYLGHSIKEQAACYGKIIRNHDGNGH